MKTYKYDELSDKAQERAIDDYQNGWLEEHEGDPLAWHDIHKILLIDCIDDFVYTKKGIWIDEDK